MRRLAALLLAATNTACVTTAPPRETATLMAPQRGTELLAQCSRPAPQAATEFFMPTAQEITAVETATATALRRAAEGYSGHAENDRLAFAWPDDPALYNRQYVGYREQGRRKIYGNFVPDRFGPSSTRPTVICDGGPALFGVEYDIASGTVTRIAFNGGLAGPNFPVIEPQ